jgi:hypothetical protein
MNVIDLSKKAKVARIYNDDWTEEIGLVVLQEGELKFYSPEKLPKMEAQ